MFCMFIRVTYVETQFNHSNLHNFASSWKVVKNTIKLDRRFYHHEIKKICDKTRGEIFCAFAGMTPLTPNSKLCNYLASWSLTKTSQNFVQGSLSIKLTKIKTEVKFWPKVPFNVDEWRIVEFIESKIFQKKFGQLTVFTNSGPFK